MTLAKGCTDGEADGTAPCHYTVFCFMFPRSSLEPTRQPMQIDGTGAPSSRCGCLLETSQSTVSGPSPRWVDQANTSDGDTDKLQL